MPHFRTSALLAARLALRPSRPVTPAVATSVAEVLGAPRGSPWPKACTAQSGVRGASKLPVAPRAAPEAPRSEGAPGRVRGAARASGASPQLP